MTNQVTSARGAVTARGTPATRQPRVPKSLGKVRTSRRRKGRHGVLATGVVLCLALAGALPAVAQELDWAKRVGGVQGNDVETDGARNSYMAGLFEATTTFGAGEANETTLTSAGDFDILVARHDPSGALVWAKRAGGTGLDWGYALALDGAGNSYVTGRFTGTATFDSTVMTTAGSDDVFVAKYDSSGALVWARRAGGSSTDEGRGIAIDSAGNSYVSGFFAGNATFGLGDLNQTTLTSAGSLDIFVAKYDPNGELVWARRAGGSSSDDAFEIATDGAGNSYVTGRFGGTATFGLGDANQTTLTSAGSLDVFVANYDFERRAGLGQARGWSRQRRELRHRGRRRRQQLRHRAASTARRRSAPARPARPRSPPPATSTSSSPGTIRAARWSGRQARGRHLFDDTGLAIATMAPATAT